MPGIMFHRYTQICRFICGFSCGFFCSLLIRQLTLEPLERDGCQLLKPYFRYQNLSKETNAKELVLVAIMTHMGTVRTRAVGIKETWGREIPGKLLFFVGQSTNKTDVDLPLITLLVADDIYPPQRKSMFMLKYVHEHYAEHFRWFVRADDDVYIRGDNLARLLQSVDSSDDVLLGHQGTGTKNEEGKLGLNKNTNFCIGGTGIIMSQSVLKKVYPHLDRCLSETVTDHEDSEVGRCLRRFVGVQCPWGYEASELFQQEYGDPSNAYHDELDYIVFERAISLHPIKDFRYQYRFHVFYLSLKVRQNQNHADRLREELRQTKKLLTLTEKSRFLITRTPDCDENNCEAFHDKNSTNHQDALPVIWTSFSDSQSFNTQTSAIPVDAIQGLMEGGLRRVIEKAKLAIKDQIKTELYHSLKFGKNCIGYLMHHPVYGNSYEIHYVISANRYFDGKRRTVCLQKRANIRSPFGDLLSRIDRRETPELVNIVLPLSGSLQSFRQFLKSVEEILAKLQVHLRVLIVFFRQVTSPKPYKSLFDSYTKTFLKVKFVWLEVDSLSNPNIALQAAMKYFSNKNNLFFFSQDEKYFDAGFLQRCRQNTAAGKVYFPVPFRTHRNTENLEKKFACGNNFGQWYPEDFSTFCAYSNDLTSAQVHDGNVSLGEGSLVERFLARKDQGIEIFRAPDPGLLHTFGREPQCLVKQDNSCINGLNSTKTLIDYMIKKNYLKDYL